MSVTQTQLGVNCLNDRMSRWGSTATDAGADVARGRHDQQRAHQAFHAHETSDCVTSEGHASSFGCHRQAGTSVHTTAIGMQLSQGDLEHRVALMTCAGADLAFAPRVVAGTTHFQYAAEHGDGINGVLRLDEPEGHVDSLAKNAAAFFRIPRSMRKT